MPDFVFNFVHNHCNAVSFERDSLKNIVDMYLSDMNKYKMCKIEQV